MVAHERTETGSETSTPFENRAEWRGGAAAGLVATVAMGVAITLTDLGTLRSSIAALYGFEGSLVVGWIAHLVHGTVFGVVFAAVLSDPGLAGIERWVWKTGVAGVVYALVLSVVGAGFVMPVWLGLVGAGSAEVPTITTPSVAWHLVYGLVLGVLYAFAAESGPAVPGRS
jgi:hypothetical protein